jgi:aminopeptidase N/puromycin-sensitive aminopeptidase
MKKFCSNFALPILAATALLLTSAGRIHAQRLPENAKPESYTLTLTPDLKAATFSGVESIDVRLATPSTTITLNAIEIEFKSVSVTAGGKEQKATIALDKEKEQATFTFPEAVPAGKATLHIEYNGILNNELRGFYLSKTAKRNYAVTQFESTDARRAFPSFDEPALKATYDVSLIIDKDDTAISNGEIVSDTPGPVDGKHTLHFARTPKMSTYLVAFLVGDFQCSSGSSDGVAIRVCGTPDKVALTHYGVGVAEKVLHYYNNYFGIPYPLKKLDLIGIPDFEAGAMENFGAITYRETALLMDEKTATVGTREEVALVIAHEMAHQWFGDLVTMQWWDNLWLNEGFATWMELKSVHDLYPEWKMEEAAVAQIDETLNLDAQPTTRAIRAKADTPDEINQMFDGISYGKAGSVLYSVENYLGEETFRQGVHNYLQAHLYGNATAEDFWGAQTANSHKPIDKIMASLVAQPGEALLTFGEPKDGQIAVRQQRFFLSPGIKPDPAQQWTLPVCFKTGSGQQCQVLTPATTTLKVPAASLLFANANGAGYYRSAYAPATYRTILENVESKLTPTERISLLGDEWVQVRANQASVGDYLNLIAAVKNDASPSVISSALSALDSIHDRIAATPEEKKAVEQWARQTLEPVYAKLPAPTDRDDSNLRELRAELFGFLGDFADDPAILAEARKLAQQFLADPASMDSTFGQTALRISATHGDAALFDQLQKLYETSTNPELQEGALRLLARFEDPALVERALNYAVSGKVRNQDAAIQLATPLYNDATRAQAWKFITSNWEKVQAQLTTAMGGRLVGATGNFCSAEERTAMKSFFDAHKVPASDKSLTSALEHIDGCIEFRSLQEPKLKAWIASTTK